MKNNQIKTYNNFKLDFIGVGPPKCGTTWIYECLKEHPEICVSIPKEINFFNKNYSFFRKNETWQYTKGLSWYSKHFSHCKKHNIIGEICPSYFADIDTPYLIYKNFPNIKIIITLRNPTKRLYSEYLHGKYRYSNLKGNCPSLKKMISNQKFIQTGFYYKYILNYLKYFDEKQILVLIQEDSLKNPQKYIQNIYKFLNVEQNYKPKSLNKQINKIGPKIHNSKFLYLKFKKYIMNNKIKHSIIKIVKFLNLSNFLYKTTFAPLDKITDLLSKKKYDYKPLKPHFKQQIDEIYSKHNKQLKKFLSRHLREWD